MIVKPLGLGIASSVWFGIKQLFQIQNREYFWVQMYDYRLKFGPFPCFSMTQYILTP
jgi:hypothetical protein